MENNIRANQTENISNPDNTVSVREMKKYGYGWEGMLPLTKGRAMELFDNNLPVYRLMPDDTEALIEEKEGLSGHDGLFGIEKDTWEAYAGIQAECVQNGIIQPMQ